MGGKSESWQFGWLAEAPGINRIEGLPYFKASKSRGVNRQVLHRSRLVVLIWNR
jgi:hypothetical protein